MTTIQRHQDLIVFQKSIDAAVDVFHACQNFPSGEKWRLADQWLRSSRSVCGNIAEAWRKRYYRAHFFSKLSDSEGEAAESQTWALLAQRCGLIDETISKNIIAQYDEILSILVTMAKQSHKWVYIKDGSKSGLVSCFRALMLSERSQSQTCLSLPWTPFLCALDANQRSSAR
jgi:four helix bundle protein